MAETVSKVRGPRTKIGSGRMEQFLIARVVQAPKVIGQLSGEVLEHGIEEERIHFVAHIFSKEEPNTSKQFARHHTNTTIHRFIYTSCAWTFKECSSYCCC